MYHQSRTRLIRRVTTERTASALVGLLAATVVASVVASAAAQPPSAPRGLTGRQVVAHCQDAVRAQLVRPGSAQFGTYRVTHADAASDYLLTGGALADTAEQETKPVTYRCNVQPFNGATVADVMDGAAR